MADLTQSLMDDVAAMTGAPVQPVLSGARFAV